MLNDLWQEIWSRLDVTPPDALLTEIRLAYEEPQRYYHTGQHLQECLVLWDETRQGGAEDPLVALALYFHDAVYDPRAGDNEERSADWAVQALAEAGMDASARERVRDLILATKHHDASNDIVTAWLQDIDLAILGSATERFQEYEEQIRQEYAWLTPEAYREGRAAVLRGFLQRPDIYLTRDFRKQFEGPARRNLAAALDRLQP